MDEQHGTGLGWPAAVLALVAAAGYLGLARFSIRRHGGGWPVRSTILWLAGLVLAVIALARPGHDFRAHMTGHLLLGMLVPILLVLAAPVTLALRALPVPAARRLAHVLRSRPARAITHPVTAAILNAGGAWILYTTDLYPQMSRHPVIALLVHAHVLLSGFLFTAAMIGVDPAPHRPGRRTRAAVIVAFLAVHGMLAKHLYAYPPAGVPAAEAQSGAQLMYYGGDLAHLLLVVIFCAQWYAATTPDRRPTTNRRRTWRLPAGT
ncbi:cytochrome c oxidase assembly protein [Actinoplanes sp. CA-015351]|uniref:cytochrome c oxidase assembly protein n=1 Tax=Actinoplanes sp. CA-015351 TaxID=3239897 RepID=UPI003D99A263